MDSVRDVNQEYVDTRSLGQFAADGVAMVAGFWSFIILFLLGLLLLAFLNTEVLSPRKEAFDPYPYVFLNLILYNFFASCGTSPYYYDVAKSPKRSR